MITTSWTCDYCGEAIFGPHYAVIRVKGLGIDVDTGDDVDLDGCDRHYHAGHVDSCYRLVLEALWLAEDAGPTLETIPTISNQAVAARRRKHTKRDEEA